jgi:phosphoglycolate phosphatase
MEYNNIIKLLKRYCINKDEFCYVGDALSDVVACREVSVTCLSAAWSNGVGLEELKKINPNHIFNDVCSLKRFLERTI